MNETVLSSDEQLACEGLITEAECLEALKSMQTDKTPGTDGLPVEFYKFFSGDISNFLLPALNHGYETGCLSITQRRGVIKLIPKKDAEPFYTKTLGPLNSSQHQLQNRGKSYR